MQRISRTLLRTCRSTPNLQLRALTSPAAAALEYPLPRQSVVQEYTRPSPNNHHHHNARSAHLPIHRNDQLLNHHHHQSSSSSSSSSGAPNTTAAAAGQFRQSQTSATIFITSLNKGGIDLTPSGTKALSQILTPVPYSAISSSWLKLLDSAITTSHLNSPTQNRTNRHTGKRLQPLSSKLVWKEWVSRQVDGLAERFVAMEGWGGVVDFEYWIGDGGVVVKGDEEVRRILEVMVRNGWVVPVAEVDGEDGGVFEVVRPGKVGRFEAGKFAF
ncbi:hypothetical protein TWF730_003335 [Orbilia blumenaviensis]|uniref:Uncharacterized protein n=1 Tax=Orbilia blumenaviensis TaxID=1796055 RepID=A0AAV9U8I5_9PEZI